MFYWQLGQCYFLTSVEVLLGADDMQVENNQPDLLYRRHCSLHLFSYLVRQVDLLVSYITINNNSITSIGDRRQRDFTSVGLNCPEL